MRFDEVTGEKHVADVETRDELVIEFQHSKMSPEELRSREKFYGRMIWIVDGRSFAPQFKVYENPLPHPKSYILEGSLYAPPAFIIFKNKNVLISRFHLIRDQEIMTEYRGHHFFVWKYPRSVWFEATAPVFIDFGTHELFRLMIYHISRLAPKKPRQKWCVQRISKQALVEKNGGTYSSIAKDS